MEKNNPTHVKDYLHLYLGCPIYDFHNKKIGILFGINRSGVNNVKILHGDDVWNVRYTSVKLLLRPLSDMTEEELQECGNMVYDFSDYPELNNHKWQDFEIGMAPEQFYYLLSKHFDLFGLIDAGLAIDKTKIKSL